MSPTDTMPAPVPPAVAAFVARLDQQHTAGTLKWPDQQRSRIYSKMYRLRKGRPVLPKHFDEIVEWLRGTRLALPTGMAEAAREQHEAWYRATATERGRRREARLTDTQRATHDRKKTRVYTPLGIRADAEIDRLWGTHGRFCDDTSFDGTGFDRMTLTNMLTGRYPPRRATLEKFLMRVNAKRQEHSERPLTPEWLTRTPGRSVEPAPTCMLCGVREVRSAERRCRTCAPIQRISAHKLTHPGNKMLVALVAEAAQVPRDVTASRLHVPRAAVTDWITPRMPLVKRLRSLLRRMSPLHALANVLGISMTATREYVYGRGYRRRKSTQGTRRRGPTIVVSHPRFAWPARLPEVLGMSPQEFCVAFGRQGMYADALRERGSLMARARWTPHERGRRRSLCSTVRGVIHQLLRGKTWGEAADEIENGSGGRAVYTPKELRCTIADHVRCPRCCARIAHYLSAHERKSERAIAERLGVSLGTAHAVIQRGQRQAGVVASGLRIGQVAAMLKKSRSTVRRWAASGRLPSIRTRGGRRYFNAYDVRRIEGSVHTN